MEARQADSPAVLFNTIVKGHADVVMVGGRCKLDPSLKAAGFKF